MQKDTHTHTGTHSHARRQNRQAQTGLVNRQTAGGLGKPLEVSTCILHLLAPLTWTSCSSFIRWVCGTRRSSSSSFVNLGNKYWSSLMPSSSPVSTPCRSRRYSGHLRNAVPKALPWVVVKLSLSPDEQPLYNVAKRVWDRCQKKHMGLLLDNDMLWLVKYLLATRFGP